MPWPLPTHPRTRDDLVLAKAFRTFHVVRARPREILARRGPLTIVFRQVEPHRAAVLFRRGELDEAPVPLGDIRAALADETVGRAVRVTRLRAVDALVLRHVPPALRAVLSETADRRAYALLVPEDLSAAAPSPPARVFRAAKRRIRTFEGVRVRIAADDQPMVRYGASLLVAAWRDLGLDVRLVPGDQASQGRLARLDAPHPPDVPIAAAVDARFVSSRVRAWRENARGVVDYARVTLQRRAR